MPEAAPYLAPGLGFLALIFAVPLAYSVGVSLVRWSLLRPDLGVRWAGLANFQRMLMDPLTWQTLGRTLFFVVGAVVLELFLGTITAFALHRGLPGSRVITSIILVPFMMTPVVAAFAWRFLLNNDFGPLPWLFRWLGWTALVDPPVLANPALVLPVLIGLDAWQAFPFVTLVVLAGLKALPAEPFEASLVDGAGAWQRLWHITIPLLRPAFLVAVVIRTLSALRLFDAVYVVTGGGPGSSSEVLSFYTYRMAFQSYQLGYAGALGVLSLIVALLMTLAYRKGIGWE
ncbi:sugar ABC transporter permease [Carboxydochorda subterranea]|uniref:Sugar ABC transporter permease n=1 Tax=Carboxydichorda subterranea TaxID=3109565 RepID=A0ABZ1BUG0_9FIRM|nr:sugar ABC transporter permease [Limnochorda sp. L945t]WRP16296.1 sugar ABC transporter permease [Limnochorda sp. L945t]